MFLTPALRALNQITDPVFLGVVAHSVFWSLLAFALLAVGVFYGLHAALADHGWWSWLAGLAGASGTVIVSLWLFLPLATVIASLFVERIAAAVEARYYPGLPPGQPASLASQTTDALLLGLRVLIVQLLAFPLMFIPVIGVVLGWLVAAWAVGRGLFEPIAMLRTDRASARALYRSARPAVLFQGALITLCGLVPVLNLLAPILGVAAMVHVLQARVVPPAPGVLRHRGQRSLS
jgi:uncharacterized protein involved in cysteine biosynthesis